MQAVEEKRPDGDSSQSSSSNGGIFTNQRGQLRAGWKIALLWVAFIASVLVLSIIVTIPFLAVEGRAFEADPIYGGVTDVLQELGEIGSVIFMVFVIEKSRLGKFGLPNVLQYKREVGYGLLWGALSIVFVFLVFSVTGNAALKNGITHPVFTPNLLFSLFLMVLVGFGEEMMSRGYTMTVIMRQTGRTWVGITVSAVIFSCMHLLNPHVSALGVINLILFGILTAVMYLKSGSLWMPIAYHAAWDYFEGNVFGFPNSGQHFSSMYPFEHVSDNWLTGGGFGPEAGILVTGILLVTMLWISKGYHRKDVAHSTI